VISEPRACGRPSMHLAFFALAADCKLVAVPEP
jgi:hypothetical protein